MPPSRHSSTNALGNYSTDGLVENGGFRQPDGRFTPEREALHDRLLAKVFTPEAIARATPRAGEEPVLTILGGRGGSGKSWISDPSKGGPVDPSRTIVIDADYFKGELPGYEGWNAFAFHEESDHLVQKASQMARALGINIAHDETLKSANKAPGRIADFTKAGYEVEGFYMFAPPEVAAGRALQRFTRGQEKTAGTASFPPK